MIQIDPETPNEKPDEVEDDGLGTPVSETFDPSEVDEVEEPEEPDEHTLPKED